MSKEIVDQLVDKYNRYGQTSNNYITESASISNEVDQIVDKIKTTNDKKINELNNNKNLLTQLEVCQLNYDNTNNQLNTEKSVLNFIQQMLGEYNEYTPINTNNTTRLLGSTLNIEIDKELSNVSNETNV